jgi:hypothetical protein
MIEISFWAFYHRSEKERKIELRGAYGRISEEPPGWDLSSPEIDCYHMLITLPTYLTTSFTLSYSCTSWLEVVTATIQFRQQSPNCPRTLRLAKEPFPGGTSLGLDGAISVDLEGFFGACSGFTINDKI